MVVVGWYRLGRAIGSGSGLGLGRCPGGSGSGSGSGNGSGSGSGRGRGRGKGSEWANLSSMAGLHTSKGKCDLLQLFKP